MLCKFDGDVPLPAIWSHQVRRLFVFLFFLLFCISISTCVGLFLNLFFIFFISFLFVCVLSRFVFVFPNQVLEEYKKRYPEEELPDFLRLNLVCWINLINFDRHQFRDHVKDNAIRTYLRAPKKAALFESKRFCTLVPLNNRNYLIVSEVNKTLNSKHQTRSLWERGRQQIQCIWQRHRRCSLLLPGHHCCHLFVFDMFTPFSTYSP